MPTLDLHGEKYGMVQYKVHSFVYNNDLPLRIITGKSSAMRKIVLDTIKPLGYHSHYERLVNEGSLIITEQEF
jgi:hypothetical protein